MDEQRCDERNGINSLGSRPSSRKSRSRPKSEGVALGSNHVTEPLHPAVIVLQREVAELRQQHLALQLDHAALTAAHLALYRDHVVTARRIAVLEDRCSDRLANSAPRSCPSPSPSSIAIYLGSTGAADELLPSANERSASHRSVADQLAPKAEECDDVELQDASPIGAERENDYEYEVELAESMWEASLLLGLERTIGKDVNPASVFGMLAFLLNVLIQSTITAIVILKMATYTKLDADTAADLRWPGNFLRVLCAVPSFST